MMDIYHPGSSLINTMNYKYTLLQNHSNVYLQKIPIFAFRDLQCVSNISHNVTVYKQAFCYLQVMCVICFFIVFLIYSQVCLSCL